MRILVLCNIDSGVSFHRLIMPVVYIMKGKPEDFALITNDINDKVLEQGFDVVLINRSIGISAKTMSEFKLKYKFKLIVDNDDHWELDPHHILANAYHVHKIGDQIISFIKIADVCTCTHDRLAEDIKKLNTNVYVIPNALPYGDGQFSSAKTPSDKIRLFWSGSDTHAQDISLLRGPIKRLHSDGELRGKIKIVMAGYAERSKPVWDGMVSALSMGLRLDTQIYNFAKPEKYMFAACDSDIALVPLLATRFNGMKSNLKVLEAAAKKNPAIVSLTNPYLNLPACYVNKKTWYLWIRELVNDASMREEKGMELFEFCNTNFNLIEWNKVRYEVFKK